MRLLVSVADAVEARAARDGGADIIDAKDPTTGSLEPVSLSTFEQIRAAIADAAPVSAAIGDASDEAAIARRARDFSRAGATFVKVGFAPGCDTARAAGLLRAAADAAGACCRVIAVAYADDRPSLDATRWIRDAATQGGASGVLLDTRNKTGPGLGLLTDRATLQAWVAAMALCGLEVALAGRLGVDDLEVVRDAGADVAGVRGAACTGGRRGRVSAALVRQLRAAVRSPSIGEW
jgi:uncharacterized protein (UPF0264 family)